MRTASTLDERATNDGRGAPSAIVKKSSFAWWLWLIPLGAVALCLWFVYRDFVSSGPLITIYFENADGLEEGNTLVTYRGATVGQVKGVTLTKDTHQVKVTARLAGSARNLAREGSVFWIVRPELRVGAISGLRTIVSGEYITVEPGSGPATNTFAAVEKPPITPAPKALQITVLAPSLGSLQEQSPIFYRGVQVGEVLYYQLESDARGVVVHARIWEPYAPLVRSNSQFWNAGGLDLRMGLFKGVQITAESPKTVIGGGIEFATPADFQAPASDGAVFFLSEKPEDKWKAWSPSINLQLPAQASHTNATAPSYLK